MKNPNNKTLVIQRYKSYSNDYGLVLSNLAIAESNLVRAGKDSAMPHFLALVKEIEKIHGFTFEIKDEKQETQIS